MRDSHPLPHDSVQALRILNGENRTVQTLKSLGYKYAMYNAGLYTTQIACSGIEDYCVRCEGAFDEADILLLQKTPLFQLIRRFAPGVYQKIYTQCPMSIIGEQLRKNTEPPVFVLGHNMAMHDPMHVEADCTPSEQPYSSGWMDPKSEIAPKQLECLNSQVPDMVDSFISDFPDPIILLSGDHGIWASHPKDDGLEAMKLRFGIFTAIRLPERCRNTIPKRLTPINHYELALACIQRRTPELLEDRIFFTRYLSAGDAQSPIDVIQKSLQELTRVE